MNTVYRLCEYRDGFINEIAFVEGKENAIEFLNSCNSHNEEDNVFYFAVPIQIER